MGFRKNDGLQTEFFGVWLASPPKNETLLKVSRLVDWEVLRIMMKPLYKDDSQVFEELIDHTDAGEVYADKAYDSKKNRAICERLGARPCIMTRARAGKPLTDDQRHENNQFGKNPLIY